MDAAREIAFGRFRLDLANECLRDGTTAISLRPKAFAVLKLLLDRPGLLVTKQQVLDAVWPGTFVGDAVLKDNIRQLRAALHDDAESPSYIETAHRRGYRFIGTLAEPSPGNYPENSALKPVSQISPGNPIVNASPATEILGRDEELAQMRGWLDRALAGERQLVFVTGEPGIGKTTIVEAFLRQAGNVPGILVARGQCLEQYGSGEPYLPLLDGFSRLCRSLQGDRVKEILRQQAPNWLAQMPGLVSPAEREKLQSGALEASRERMLREMADAVERLTSESPLLLVVEDLHWSDYSTLDLFSYLARRRDPARLMLIATYRPVDVILGDHPLKVVKRELQAHGLCHELALEYLSENAIAEYLERRFPSHQLPSRFRREVYRRTEGNPLFVVNLVEYLIEQKAIVEEKGTWKLGCDLSEAKQDVPSNLRELIEREIERLTPDERNVLGAASVAGMECSSVAIAAGLDMPVEWVERQCEQLAGRHQFLSPAWLAELPDGTVTARHRFNHVLYLKVAYRLLSPMRRSQIHQRIAERGVAIYGNRSSEIAAELAMHFEQSRDWPCAVQHLLQAAENAMARSAHHEAADLAKRGVDILKFIPESTERDQQEMKLRMLLGVSLMAMQGFASAEAEAIYARGRELFWRYGPSTELFYMLWSLNLYKQFSGEMQSSLDISYQMLQLAETLQDKALTMQAHRALGAVLLLLGRCSEAFEYIEKGASLCASLQNHRNSVFVVLDSKVMFECFAAMALLPLGYSDQSTERLATGLSLARKLGHPQTLVVAQHVAAQIHQMRGEAELVYEFAKAAVELSDEYGLELWRAYGIIELGWAEAELGNAQAGIEQIERGLALHESMGSKLRSPYFLSLLADQLFKAGRVEDGLASIAKGITLAEQTGERFLLAELYRIKGSC